MINQVRISEIAQETAKKPKDVLSACHALGINANTASSAISISDAEWVMEYLISGASSTKDQVTLLQNELQYLRKRTTVLEAVQNKNEELSEALEKILQAYESNESLSQEEHEKIRSSIKLSEEKLEELKKQKLEEEAKKHQALLEESKKIDDATAYILTAMKTNNALVLVYTLFGILIVVFGLALAFWATFPLLNTSIELKQTIIKTLDGKFVNYLAYVFPSIFLIVVSAMLLRFGHQLLKLKSSLLNEKNYIEKISGVLKGVNSMSEYYNSTEEVRRVFNKVVDQLIQYKDRSQKEPENDDFSDIGKKEILDIARISSKRIRD